MMRWVVLSSNFTSVPSKLYTLIQPDGNRLNHTPNSSIARVLFIIVTCKMNDCILLPLNMAYYV